MSILQGIIRQPVTVAVGVILVGMMGLIAVQRIPIQLTPNVEDTVVSVTTRWEGASPQEVEQEIIDEQEDKLQGIANLRSMTSTSQQGVGTIKLEFKVGTRKEDALREVSDKLREVPEYPDNADEPVIEASDPENRDYIAWIVFQTDDPDFDIRTLQDFADDRIKPELERVPGMSEINVLGGREREVRILYDPVRLAQREITPTRLVTAIRVANRNVSAGEIPDSKSDVRVRTLGQFTSVTDVEKTIVSYTASGPVFVGDVAEVVETYKDPTAFVRSRGQPVIAINAQKEVGANVMQVMEGLQAALERLNKPEGLLATQARKIGLDGGLTLTQVYDQTIYIHDALQLVQDNILYGGVLAIIVLLLFLRSIRSTVIVALAIPISVIGAIVAMVAMGRSINVISLAGMAFAVGMVVDNAIVVLENIYRHLELGKKPMQAAHDGAREVWGAILAATLTTIVVFIPILLVEEEAGQLFRDIALAICAAVGLSLIVAVTVIPTTGGRLLKAMARRGKSTPAAAPPGFLKRWLPFHRVPDLVAGTVHRLCGSWLARLGVVAVFTVAAVVGTLVLRPPADYLPQGNRNLVFGFLIPPAGYNLDQQAELAGRIESFIEPYWEAGKLHGQPGYEDAVARLPSVPTFDMRRMAPGPPVTPPPLQNYFIVSFPGAMFHGGISREPKRVVDLIPLFNHATRSDVAPGVLAFVRQVPLFRIGGRSGSAVKINFSGADLDRVTAAAMAAYGRLVEQYGPFTVQPDPANFNIPGPELQVVPNRVRLANAGLTPEDLALVVQTNGDGAIIGEYRIGSETIDLKLISQNAARGEMLNDLRDVPVATSTGQPVPLSAVAELNRISAPQQINRVGRQRAVTLQFTPPKVVPLETAVSTVDGLLHELRQSGAIPADVETSYAGSASKLRSVQKALLGDGTLLGGMTSSLGLALIVVYLLMCVLFQSFVRPLVILFSVPLATLGGFLALFLVHLWSQVDPYMPVQNLDVLTMLGFVILIGVVVNNAILIVHQSLNFMRGLSETAEGRRDPLPSRDAITEAVRTRVRPIFMSMLTSVGGMAPLVFMPGSGSELYRGLGSVVIGGLIVSTLFTLFLVPLLFSLVTDLGARLARQEVPVGTREQKSPAPAAATLLLVSLGLVVFAGCARPKRAERLERLVDEVLRTELEILESTSAAWRVTTQAEPEIEKTVAPRLSDLEEIAGPRSFAGAPLPLGEDLTGAEQKSVKLPLAHVIESTVQNQLSIELARLQSAIDEQGIIREKARFDSVLYADSGFERLDDPRRAPELNGVRLGVDNSAHRLAGVDVGVRKRLISGATVSASTLFERLDDRTPGIDFTPDPAYRTGVALSVSQPLLRGFGPEVNEAEITLAINQGRISVQDLERELQDRITEAEQAYWNLALAKQILLIQQRLLQQGVEVKDLLEERREFDARPAQYADAVATVQARSATLLRAQRLVRAASDALKILINDPEYPLGGEVLLEAGEELPSQALEFSLKESILTALRERPEVQQAILGIDDATLRERVAENLLLPQLDLTTEVSYAGLDDDSNGAWESLSRDSFFTLFVGLSFEFPVGNRAAEADLERAVLERRQSLVELRRTVQGVVDEVKSALRDLETHYQLIEATRSLRIAQTENLRALLAEEETQQRAPTPEFLNLKFQRQDELALAQAQEIAALADYNRALAVYYRAIGKSLERRGVSVSHTP